jgi:hypothetical protein
MKIRLLANKIYFRGFYASYYILFFQNSTFYFYLSNFSELFEIKEAALFLSYILLYIAIQYHISHQL